MKIELRFQKVCNYLEICRWLRFYIFVKISAVDHPLEFYSALFIYLGTRLYSLSENKIQRFNGKLLQN